VASSTGDKAKELSSSIGEKLDEVDWDKVLEATLYILAGVLVVVASGLCLKFVGFGIAGVVAGSMAAFFMSCAGIIARGSCFALAQTLGATRYLFHPKALLLGAACGFVVLIITFITA
jgi:hypothetical protein